MECSIGTALDKEQILKQYPYTAQVIHDDGYIVIATNDEEIMGFAFVFRRSIPAPVADNYMEDFINVIEVFNETDRNHGIGSALVEKCIEVARANKNYQIRAYCDINNVTSHRLWIKNKFGISPVKMPDGSILGSFVTYVL